MSTWGAFQSIFQLAAALNIGVSGLLSLWNDPFAEQNRELQTLEVNYAQFQAKRPDAPADIKRRVEDLSNKCSDLKQKWRDSDAAFVSKVFWWVKVISVIFAMVSLIFLVVSSNNFEDRIDWLGRALSIFLLAPVPAFTLVLSIAAYQFGRRLVNERRRLESGYNAVVTDYWGWRNAQ